MHRICEWSQHAGLWRAWSPTSFRAAQVSTSTVVCTRGRPIYRPHRYFRPIFDLSKIGRYAISNFTLIRDPDNIGHRYYLPIFDFKYRYRFQKNDTGWSVVYAMYLLADCQIDLKLRKFETSDRGYITISFFKANKLKTIRSKTSRSA